MRQLVYNSFLANILMESKVQLHGWIVPVVHQEVPRSKLLCGFFFSILFLSSIPYKLHD